MDNLEEKPDVNISEEINEIIGFEGKCTNEENKVYVWELTEDTNVEVPDSLKRRDTPTPAQTVSNRKTTPTSVPTPLQPTDWRGLDDPIE